MPRKKLGDRVSGIYERGTGFEVEFTKGGKNRSKFYNTRARAESAASIIGASIAGSGAPVVRTESSEKVTTTTLARGTSDTYAGGRVRDWLEVLWEMQEEIRILADADPDGLKSKLRAYSAVTQMADVARKYVDIAYTTQAIQTEDAAKDDDPRLIEAQLIQEIRSSPRLLAKIISEASGQPTATDDNE